MFKANFSEKKYTIVDGSIITFYNSENLIGQCATRLRQTRRRNVLNIYFNTSVTKYFENTSFLSRAKNSVFVNIHDYAPNLYYTVILFYRVTVICVPLHLFDIYCVPGIFLYYNICYIYTIKNFPPILFYQIQNCKFLSFLL